MRRCRAKRSRARCGLVQWGDPMFEQSKNSAPIRPEIDITAELPRRSQKRKDWARAKRAITELQARIGADPDRILPRLVELILETTGGSSASLCLYEEPAHVLRWNHGVGTLAALNGKPTPRQDSPYGAVLDKAIPVLLQHPERIYQWLVHENVSLPEVLIVPLFLGRAEPLGTLWIVSDMENYFDAGDASIAKELADFVGFAVRMQRNEERLRTVLRTHEVFTREMSYGTTTLGIQKADFPQVATPRFVSGDRKLSQLASASMRIAGAASVDSTLQEVADQARSVIGAHLAATHSVQHSGWTYVRFAVSLSEKYRQFRGFKVLPTGAGIYSRALLAKGPLRLSTKELPQSAGWQGFSGFAGRHPPLRGLLVVPLLGRTGYVIGVVMVSDKAEGDFTADDEAILVQLAQIASVCAERTLAIEALERSGLSGHDNSINRDKG